MEAQTQNSGNGVETSDSIIAAIRSGKLRKVEVPGFRNAAYFADPGGHVYSLYNPSEPKFMEPKLGNGLMWVTLYEHDGVIRKLMVGEIIAHTFLNYEGRDTTLSTVLYRDGNTANNAADNLDWGTPQQQQQQLRSHHFEKKAGQQTEEVGAKGTTPANGTEIPFSLDPEKDPLLDQLHALQKKLEAEQRISSNLRDALAPFAMFHLGPSDAADLGRKVVLEANRGGNNHSVLTVQDFRNAMSTYNKPDAAKT
jgi:hypothetical protein